MPKTAQKTSWHYFDKTFFLLFYRFQLGRRCLILNATPIGNKILINLKLFPLIKIIVIVVLLYSYIFISLYLYIKPQASTKTTVSMKKYIHHNWRHQIFLHDEPIFRLHSTTFIVTVIYKITKIVRALRLAERSVCMRVCKHGCGVRLFGFSRAKFEKVFDFKTR